MTSRDPSPAPSWSRASSAAPPDGTPADNLESSMMGPDASHGGKRKSKHGAAPSSANGAVPTVGKIRHLKKEDGEPLWRRDIQYDFLRAVFDDPTKAFTNSYEAQQVDERQSFADLYIDTMARSSKTSKVLRDKLLSDREAAKSMAMVCLLVNVGRMNTTLNFFPEMRAQLRTYHAIPSLQAHQDASAYKQLQDAPRLKSILKGAAEDRPEPHELTEFKEKDPPRSNPVNLIFLICAQASNIAELHFPSGGEFHDLIMKTNYSSKSRARGFLWLMWQYLESDFTEEGCEENPFGAGVDYKTGVANQGIPRMEELTTEEEALENIDPQEEIDFGREKQAHRAKIIAADQAYMAESQNKRGSRVKAMPEDGPTAAILPRIRPSKHESDLDSTRSTPPPRNLSRIGAASTGRRPGAPLKYQIYEGSSPAPTPEPIVGRKPRPLTAHQKAVEENRDRRVLHLVDRKLRHHHHVSRKIRRQEGTIIRTKRRLEAMTDPFEDSEEELKIYATNKASYRTRGFGGLIPLPHEVDDYGEEFASYSSALRRANRRLKRWHLAHDQYGEDVVAPTKRAVPRNNFNDASPEDDSQAEPEMNIRRPKRSRSKAKPSADANGDATMEDADDLDDMDKELLGLGGDDDEGAAGADAKDDDEELDDVDKTLLGLDDSDGNESS
ncbi:hypothetical protein F4778DRAFT_775935 [Xylariomycetidae sp. FL2044]|nr:hypothetical protein F4778DRAFT_775935 [Xylariomycetidae sp. FL2044]